MEREELLKKLRATIQINGHILLVAPGNGMSAQYVIKGGADLITAISAGRIRQMGQSAFSGFFSCLDTNQMVMEYASKEILPVAGEFPVVVGLFVQDPCIHIYEYLQKIKENGFSGIINYPSAGFFGGKFRRALERAGMGFEKEVEAIRIAHFLGLFTVAYVFDVKQAVAMAEAGADMICVHFGITGGGLVGASQVISLETAMKTAETIYKSIDNIRPDILKIISGGPVQTPIDAKCFYQNTRCQGFLGGSSIERLPVERAVINTVRAFKSPGDFNETNIISKVLNGNLERVDYARFMLEYIQNNFAKKIRLKDLAVITHMSPARLSVLFKEKTGCTFTEYLIEFRMDKAKEYLIVTHKPIKEISVEVGYEDYSQFTKMFSKVTGMTPQEYRRRYGHEDKEAGFKK